MGKFTGGLVTGGIIGAIGLGYALSDRRTRRRILKDSRRAMHRANDALENVASKF